MKSPHASRAGTCVYCGRLATETCQFCGGNVCGEHFDKEAGSCISCLRGKRIR